MPSLSVSGQPDSASACNTWFRSAAGRALLDSERPIIQQALAERPGQSWLWLGPVTQSIETEARGLYLMRDPTHGSDSGAIGWTGAVHCGLPLPLASESAAVLVLQHVAGTRPGCRELLSECARVLVPGGRLWLFALNPLAPYRWRWRGSGLRASEPLTWRRRLRGVGLASEPVSQGVGPGWKISASQDLQHGPGLRAAYVIRAEKRTLPLTPTRRRAPLRLPEGVPAG